MIEKEWVKGGIILGRIARESLSEGMIVYHRPQWNKEMRQPVIERSDIPDRPWMNNLVEAPRNKKECQ